MREESSPKAVDQAARHPRGPLARYTSTEMSNTLFSNFYIGEHLQIKSFAEKDLLGGRAGKGRREDRALISLHPPSLLGGLGGSHLEPGAELNTP